MLLLNFDNSNSRTENNTLILSLLPSVCLQVKPHQKHEISFLVIFIFSLIRYLLIKYCFSFFFFLIRQNPGPFIKAIIHIREEEMVLKKVFTKKKVQRIPSHMLCVEYFLLFLLFL